MHMMECMASYTYGTQLQAELGGGRKAHGQG